MLSFNQRYLHTADAPLERHVLKPKWQTSISEFNNLGADLSVLFQGPIREADATPLLLQRTFIWYGLASCLAAEDAPWHAGFKSRSNNHYFSWRLTIQSNAINVTARWQCPEGLHTLYLWSLSATKRLLNNYDLFCWFCVYLTFSKFCCGPLILRQHALIN